MFTLDPEKKKMILLDCLSCGIPWPESRKMAYRVAPEKCRSEISDTGDFFEIEEVSDAEKQALNDLPKLHRVFEDMDEYVKSVKSGIRVDDAKLKWYAGLDRSGSAMKFYWADLREDKIKILFYREFWSSYQKSDLSIDQVSEVFRYYNRILQTFRRIRHLRWIKMIVRQGRLSIYLYDEKEPYPNQRSKLAFDRSFYSGNLVPDCSLLDSEKWEDAPAHIKKRIDFWKKEETGALTDEFLRECIQSDDEILVSWAIRNLRRADDPYVIDQIKKRVESQKLDEAKISVRVAGRLWLNQLENEVMSQYNRRGNSMGPAVAEYIGSIGVTGRSFLPKILRSLTRRGDFATLISSIRALGSFPHSMEARALPEVMDLMLNMAGNIEPVLERFPGVRTDIFGPQDPPVMITPLALEFLSASSVNAIIETTAHTSNGEVLEEIVGKFDLGSPFIEKVLEEIEYNIRTDMSDYVLRLVGDASSPEKKFDPDVPVSRRVIIATRTLMRINKPGERVMWLLKALPLISNHVGTFKKDSELKHTFHIENYPFEPYITIKSILKSLPDEHEIVNNILRHKNFSDKEKFIVQELAKD
ncbi:MAG TPA: hypothetical protein PLN69_05660 [bacterium]|nr:hypothetical protein [bacterium]